MEDVIPVPSEQKNQEGALADSMHDAPEMSCYRFPSVAGPESLPPSLLKVVMKPIAAVGESHQYPPVNWGALLSPLMRLNFGKYQVFLLLQTLLLGCDQGRKMGSVSWAALTR